ncbi:transglutaminase-like domain-containing protein [Pyrococcus horikoshii]|uniref:UPF0252 protein PH0672 n=2 Tax=Pyrococcus horikoshii TaxID=53953 RepID=Y672_PYRHO|nr:transglutaminase-like domain-containing protein [Pyrococcus horikoshii]O58405.1 RecName: Full=UPF0252 protein PH0672 [Pyrococcus horikoshii OT3]BAA29763.1 309aa long hypothetical protein [Pyrococcus horikoshii OT3]HII60816.1 hypothetical protein [Pyrococcus horikoshii]
MKKVSVIIFIVIMLGIGCLNLNESIKETCPRTSNITQAMSCYIPEDFEILKGVAEEIPGGTIEWKIWNILEWEEDHLSYDNNKGSDIILKPSEFIKVGEGVCTDYAVLTAGLLLASNISPVYLMIFHFMEDPTLHAAVAVNISGKLFILDQRLPPKNLDSYLIQFSKLEGKIILFAEMYKVEMKKGRVVVSGRKYLDLSNFGFYPGNISLDMLENLLLSEFQRRTNLFPRIDLKTVLPQGLKERKVWMIKFENFKLFYDDTFVEQYSNFIADEILKNEKIKSDISRYSAFWISIKLEGDDLIVRLFLGR